MKYWNKWSFEGTRWVDNNLGMSEVEKNYIYDNNSIDWKFVNSIKSYYKTFFENCGKPNSQINSDDDELPY
jgi:hypothetical protein